nr:MAG TPA: hypothetical protein [Caudoviricetes sp.]
MLPFLHFKTFPVVVFCISKKWTQQKQLLKFLSI